MACLMSWLESRGPNEAQVCPLCKQPWEFVEYKSPSRRAAGEQEGEEAGEAEDEAEADEAPAADIVIGDGSQDDSSGMDMTGDSD